MNWTKQQHRFVFILVFVSGMSGLIYQVVWHRYLGILLGVQARATAIVLAVFLGGISAGYFLFGKWSRRPGRNLLLAYASIEIGMAFWGFLFPQLFKVFMPATGWLYRTLGVNSLATDFLLSVLLVGPPTVLMGGTLPLLTQAFSESLEKASRTHASIYAWNTLGACVGSLIAGYFLIPLLGLPLSSLIAGMGNAIVSFLSYFAFAKGFQSPARSWVGYQSADHKTAKWTPTQLALITLGFLSGFAVITLESVLVRLMGLSSGASNYNFTLIVTIFILGLGFGSLVTRRIDRYSWGRLVLNQLAISVALLALYYSGDYWSYGAHLVRSAIRDNVENFYLYQALLGTFYLTVLIIPVGLAGLTLPLLFHFLKDDPRSLGERVGQLYAINTLGCVLGASLGGYWLYHWLNLDQILKICVAIALLGTLIALAISEVRAHLSLSSIAIVLVIWTATGYAVLRAPLFDRDRMTQAFRHQEPIQGVTYTGATAFGRHLSKSTKYIYFKDGPNASVGIGVSKNGEQETSRSIFVNGKSDGNTRGDRLTTQMLGHIPGLLSKKLDRICVIGFGTGMTIGTLSLYDENTRIDVAEISSTIIDKAYEFDAYNHGVSHNPKVYFHEMDAFRLLQGAREKFDVIVSEPSNPWVMGIENLYSEELYEIASGKLTEDGMFVQWIHTYSFNDSLFKVVLTTIGRHFPHLSVFQLRGGDMALVGTKQRIGTGDFARARLRFNQPDVRTDLEGLGIDRLETVLAYEIIPTGVALALAGTQASSHRLENPVLSDGAAKAFFSQEGAKILETRRTVREYFVESRRSSLLSAFLGEDISYSPDQIRSFRRALCDSSASANRTLCEEIAIMAILQSPANTTQFESYLSADAKNLVAFLKNGSLAVANQDDLNAFSANFDRFKKYYSPTARLPYQTLIRTLDRCLRRSPKAEIYGDCILQRIVIADSFVPGNDSSQWISRYLDWFETLPKTAASYQRKKEAGDVLRKIAQLRG